MTKFEPDNARNLVARDKLTFDERVTVHRGGCDDIPPSKYSHSTSQSGMCSENFKVAFVLRLDNSSTRVLPQIL